MAGTPAAVTPVSEPAVDAIVEVAADSGGVAPDDVFAIQTVPVGNVRCWCQCGVVGPVDKMTNTASRLRA
eukprot:7628693-Lingulodinium_polyedra.AAC.1